MPETGFKSFISPQDYLAFEEKAEARHEYVDGVVYALPGESRRHNQIAGKLYATLLGHGGDDCWVAFEGIKLWIPGVNRYDYPDVMVLCDARDKDDKIFQYPCFIAEVHSPSTRATDKREKLHAYRTIETLQAYAMIEPEEKTVELVERHIDGWRSRQLDKDDMPVACLGCTLDIKKLFDI